MNPPKFLIRTAQAFSGLFSPIIAPTYAAIIALTATFLNFASPKARITVIAVVFAFTCVVPFIAIFILHRIGVIKDALLNERRDRTIPFIVSSLAYFGVAIYLYKVHSPGWFPAFFLGSAATAVFTLIVNLWWKISGHATGMGGLIAFTFFLTLRGDLINNSQLLFMITVLIAGIVMTSRLILERHTPMQILAGFCSGVTFITISQLATLNP